MPVISAECAIAMAEGVRKIVGSDVGIAVTGVAGPAEQEGQPVGTVWLGLALPERESEAVHLRLPGQRDQIRQFATISLMDLLRRRLLGVA
jgi:nicotinamide-nucleotide amidase